MAILSRGLVNQHAYESSPLNQPPTRWVESPSRPLLRITRLLLSSEAVRLPQILDPSQHQLNDTVPRARRVPRELVARQLDLIVRHTPLVSPLADCAALAQPAAVVLNMAGDVKVVILGIFLEPLCAVPCRVLEGKERAVRREDVVEPADADDGVVSVLDDALEDLVLRGREGAVSGVGRGAAVTEDVLGRALEPFHVGGVDGVLDVGAVEVYFSAGGRVVALEEVSAMWFLVLM